MKVSNFELYYRRKLTVTVTIFNFFDMAIFLLYIFSQMYLRV